MNISSDNVIAFLPHGGSGYSHPTSPNDTCPKVCPGGNRQPYLYSDRPGGSLVDYAEHIAPTIESKGYKRIHLQCIGGNWMIYPYRTDLSHGEARQWASDEFNMPFTETRVMFFDQWEIAKKLGVPWADDDDLATMHHLFLAAGVEEVIYYLGSPALESYSRQLECVEPFLLPNASISLDHIVSPDEFAKCERLWKYVRREEPELKWYTEARPQLDVPNKYKKYISGTVASEHFDAAWPELLNNAREWGEVQRITSSPDDDMTNWPKWITPVRRGWDRD